MQDTKFENLPGQSFQKEQEDEDKEDQSLLIKEEATLQNSEPSNLRWLMLFLAILTNFGSFFCFDNPQPLQSHIERIFQVQDTEFNLLYSIQNIPSILIPFFGGIIVDSFGLRITMTTSSAFLVIGQLLSTIGAYIYKFDLMIIGRCINGFGYQVLENSLLLIISRWFSRHELALAWGYARAVLQTSNALNSFLTPRIFAYTNQLYTPFLFGLILNIFSFVCLLTIIFLDKRHKKFESIEGNNFELIIWKDIKSFPKLYYLVLILGVLGYTCFFGFNNNVNNLFVTRFGFTPETAGTLIMYMYLLAGVLSPIVGYFVDRIGKRLLFLLFGYLTMFSAHLIFAFLGDRTPESPNYGVLFGLFGISIFFTILPTTLWPSLVVIVNSNILGTAIGMVSCVNGIVQLIYPEILGIIHDHSLDVHNGYFFTQMVHCAMMVIAILMIFWAYVEDIKTNQRLNKAKIKLEDKNF